MRYRLPDNFAFEQHIRPPALAVSLVLALLLRSIVMLLTPGARYDIDSYRIIGTLVLEGKNFYTIAPGRYPYLPGWAVFEAVLVAIANQTGLPFQHIVRIPQVLADVGICAVVYRILRADVTLGNVTPRQGAFFHAVNPAAIAISAGHDQLGSLVFLGVLIAGCNSLHNRPVVAGVALGGSIIIKPLPVIFVPLYLGVFDTNRTRARFLVPAMILPALTALPFLIWSPTALIDAVLRYRSNTLTSWYTVVEIVVGHASVPLLEPLPPRDVVLSASKYLLVLPAIAVVSLWSGWRRVDLWRGILAILLVVLAVSAAVAPQYLYWPMALLPLVVLPWAYRVGYSLAAFGVLFWRYAEWYPTVYAFQIFGPQVNKLAIAGLASFLVLWWTMTVIGLWLLRSTALSNTADRE